MTTLTVSSTTDYSGSILSDVTLIDFTNAPLTTAIATFASSQFGSGHIAPTVIIDGSAGTFGIVVNLTGSSFDASQWKFANWVYGNHVTLNGTADADTITGSSQSDNIYGQGGDDVIVAGVGNDSVDGGSGNDTISGGKGGDTLLGGAGDDVFIISTNNNDTPRIDGGAGIGDTILLGSAGRTYYLKNNEFAGIESILAPSGQSNENIVLRPDQFARLSHIDLGAGSDTVTVYADPGFDFRGLTLPTCTGVEHLVLIGDSGGTFEMTGQQADAFTAIKVGIWVATTSYLFLTSTSDGLNHISDLNLTGIQAVYLSLAGAGVTLDLHRQSEDLTINGSNYADRITGSSGSNSITSGAGDDVIYGGHGADALDGGSGDDTLAGGAGPDNLFGGDGIDTASYASSAAAVSVDLTTGSGSGGDAASDALYNIENLQGSRFGDTLTGGANSNLLSGGAGNDTLTGGGGIDTLTGGGGQDTFVLSRPTANHDIISDFIHRQDHLQIDVAVFKAGLVAGSLRADQFVANATGLAQDASDRFIYNTSTGVLVFDPDGTGSAHATEIAVLSGGATLAATDFVLV